MNTKIRQLIQLPAQLIDAGTSAAEMTLELRRRLEPEGFRRFLDAVGPEARSLIDRIRVLVETIERLDRRVAGVTLQIDVLERHIDAMHSQLDHLTEQANSVRDQVPEGPISKLKSLASSDGG